jgi:hypothetical protein
MKMNRRLSNRVVNRSLQNVLTQFFFLPTHLRCTVLSVFTSLYLLRAGTVVYARVCVIRPS